jgi:hypothetical protein
MSWLSSITKVFSTAASVVSSTASVIQTTASAGQIYSTKLEKLATDSNFIYDESRADNISKEVIQNGFDIQAELAESITKIETRCKDPIFDAAFTKAEEMLQKAREASVNK